jgi:RNA polymerase sigma factor (TIGR02999 family)
MQDVTQVLAAIEQGDPRASEALLPLVYDELRKLAASKLANEIPGQTLQATALVHEAYLRLAPSGGSGAVEPRWDSRGHFFAAAAEAMRRILIEQARRKQSQKRGGGAQRVDAEIDVLSAADEDSSAADLLALDEALKLFEAEDPARAKVVKLRYFAGLSIEDTAKALGISVATTKRHWVYARSWLFGKLNDR